MSFLLAGYNGNIEILILKKKYTQLLNSLGLHLVCPLSVAITRLDIP